MVASPRVSARGDVLGRVRAALGPAPAVPDVERFCERAGEYRARVLRTTADGLAATLTEACGARGTRRLVAAPGVSWDVPGVEVVTDDATAPAAALDGAGGALTGCALAIAETGTIVLDGSPACGRRALTLVPDHHVCVVLAEQVVAAVPDAIAALAAGVREGRPITFVSGPSATSDIELERVEGVHGPRLLDIVVVAA
jgi:L-lactate dehydrogenase complex protein LldG